MKVMSDRSPKSAREVGPHGHELLGLNGGEVAKHLRPTEDKRSKLPLHSPSASLRRLTPSKRGSRHFFSPAVSLRKTRAYGQNVTESPSEKLNPAGPPRGSRYQNWKFHVEKGVTAKGPLPTGGIVKSMGRAAAP